MILLDTNVISEPLRLTGDVAVLNWIDAQAIETLFLCTISLAELRFGIAALPAGQRQDTLRTSLEQRILPLCLQVGVCPLTRPHLKLMPRFAPGRAPAAKPLRQRMDTLQRRPPPMG